MTYDQYINETTALGFLQKGKKVYGEYHGFPMYGVFGGGAKAKMVTMAVSLNRNGGGKLVRDLNKAIKGIGTSSYHAADHTILLLSVKVKEEFTGPFTQAMERFEEIAARCGVEPPSVCPLCGRENCDGSAMIKNAYTSVHKSCLERMHQGVSAQAERNLREGSYLSGICGGLAFGILATIPTILSIWFLERIMALLMMLIPLGASYGYKKCNGKRSRAAGPILIILSLASMYFMEYVFIVLTYMRFRSLTMGAALARTLPYLLDPAYWIDITKGAGIELIFLGVAIFASWKTLMETADSDISAAAVSLDTFQGRSTAASAETAADAEGGAMSFGSRIEF